ANVGRLQTLRALLGLEFHLLAFGQSAEAFRLDGGVMTEHVGAAVVLHDEPEPLRVVEPLHGTSSHYRYTSFSFGPAACRAPAVTTAVVWVYRLGGGASIESRFPASYMRHANARSVHRPWFADECRRRQPVEPRLPLARQPAARAEGHPLGLCALVRRRHFYD